LEEILRRNDKFKNMWIKQNQIKNIFNFPVYLPTILKWKKDFIQYCTICRVKLDNSMEEVVIISGCNSLVHEMYIKRYQYNKMCPICNDHYLLDFMIKNITEDDTRLFNSKTFERNQIKLNFTDNVHHKLIFALFRLKEINFISSHSNNFQKDLMKKLHFMYFLLIYQLSFISSVSTF
jgi:hypothetical protein